MEFNLVCNHTSDEQNWTTAKREPDLSITSMIPNRIRLHSVLLPINHNITISKKKINVEQIPLVETKSKIKNSSILEIP